MNILREFLESSEKGIEGKKGVLAGSRALRGYNRKRKSPLYSYKAEVKLENTEESRNLDK